MGEGPQLVSAAGVAVEGERLWAPSAEFIENSQLTRFLRWLERERGHAFAGYDALWRWSVSDLDGFWSAIWDYFDVLCDTRFERVLSGVMPDSRWFEGSRTNYAEHLLRHEAQVAPGQTAFHHSTETRPLAQMSWQELGDQVRRLATRLRALGIRPGDRIVSYMPNVPETAIAMLAAVAVGAVWSSAAPEFGARTVIERFGQIAPRLAFVADGYSFGGKTYDRRDEIAQMVEELPSLETLVWLPYLGLSQPTNVRVQTLAYAELLSGPAVPREAFRYERVPFDHPLWILFSSGTTGLPKAIVHSHVGMLLEHLKVMHLHMNLGPDSCMFFYSTTGWMMWNTVIAALIAGSAAVLYDGNPVYGGIDRLWRMAEATGATVFGASPTLVQSMKRAGLRPKEHFDLRRLECVFVGGAPATPEVFQWFYTDVKEDLWVASQSGGTELCSGLVGAVPTQPVYAGEIQGRMLGMDVQAWSDDGQALVDAVGELVVLKPAPSMPLCFWGDANHQRYRDSYFATFPGVWRHGDLFKLNARGGCYVYGRSDSTLNRFGVRIGSAEIYRVVEQLPGVKDSLVICCELPDGGYYMPLFVALEAGTALTQELVDRIKGRLRDEASPRHVPDVILQAPAIPYTLTGKKMEVPIRRIVMGMSPDRAASRDAMANPDVLAWYVAFAARPEIAALRQEKPA